MDEAISAGLGGFETRAEFINEAVGNLIGELTYPEAAPESTSRRERDQNRGAGSDLGAERDEISPDTLEDTALTTAGGIRPISEELAEVTRGPLLGLHNRDYASLWALARLARYTLDGPMEFESYLSRVTSAAWHYGERLQALQQEGGPKLALLFPTNHSKRPSAERGFQAFAIGSASMRSGRILAQGPLFLWNAVQIGSLKPLTVGITTSGARLLELMDGLTLSLPHTETYTVSFLEHLARHAPEDLAGFEMVLTGAVEEPDRATLLGMIHASRPDWTEATASSVVQGYVARAREWGLLEPRLKQGKYRITRRASDLMRLITATSIGDGS